MANRFFPKGHKTQEQIKAIKAKEAKKNRPKVSIVTGAEEKKLLLGLKKKSNSVLNRILDEPFVPPKFKDEAGRILDKRFEDDPEFKKHVREQQAELVKKKIKQKGFDTSRISVSVIDPKEFGL